MLCHGYARSLLRFLGRSLTPGASPARAAGPLTRDVTGFPHSLAWAGVRRPPGVGCGQATRTLATITKDSGIGIIGCGCVGQALCHNLTRHGWRVAGACDIDPKQMAQLPPGVPQLATPREVVQSSEVILTCLPKPPAVKAVAEGPDGVLGTIGPGQIWIDHSTTDMEQTQEYVRRVQEAGAHMLESPITGGMEALKKGQMVVYLGGDEAVAQAVRPLLQASFIKVLYVGPAIGTAMVIKVVSNMLFCVHVVAMVEALMLAKRADIDLRTFWDGIRVSVGNSIAWETAAPLIFNGTDYDPGFSLSLQNKDLQLGYDMARKFKVPMAIHQQTLSTHRQAEYQFGEDSGSYIVSKILELALNEPLQVPGFENWSYSNVVEDGSIMAKHEGIDL